MRELEASEHPQIGEVSSLLRSEEIKLRIERLIREKNEHVDSKEVLAACERRLHHRIRTLSPILGDLHQVIDAALEALVDYTEQNRRIGEVRETLYSPQLVAVARNAISSVRLPGDGHEEILGEVMLKMTVKIRRSGELPPGNLEAYLVNSVKNEAVNLLRKQIKSRLTAANLHERGKEKEDQGESEGPRHSPGTAGSIEALRLEALRELSTSEFMDGWQELRRRFSGSKLTEKDLAILDYLVGRVLGADPGRVIVGDSLSVITVLAPGTRRTGFDDLIYEGLQVRDQRLLEPDSRIDGWWRDQKRFFIGRYEASVAQVADSADLRRKIQDGGMRGKIDSWIKVLYVLRSLQLPKPD